MNSQTNNSLANIQSLDKIESNDAVEIGKWYILDKTKTDLFHYDRSWKESTEVTTADGGVLVCADSFESNLYDGDMPDFKSYLANGRLDSEAGDVFFGHRKLWDEDKTKNLKISGFMTISAYQST